MRITDYYFHEGQVVALDDVAILHFIDAKELEAFLDRNFLLDIDFFVDNKKVECKMTFDQWLADRDNAKIDIQVFIESRKVIDDILNPLNFINLKNKTNGTDDILPGAGSSN